MLLFTLGEIQRALSSSRVIILINRRASETLLSELELRQWDDGVVEAEPSSSLGLRERDLRGVSNNASVSSPLRTQHHCRGRRGFIFVTVKALASSLSKLRLRLCRGFGFVAVEASASSPSRLRLRRRRGFGFVAVEASTSSPLRLLLRRRRRFRGFKGGVFVILVGERDIQIWEMRDREEDWWHIHNSIVKIDILVFLKSKNGLGLVLCIVITRLM
ncbi:hypothetical protein ACLB2K_037743 [Fragaria x ananassa]